MDIKPLVQKLLSGRYLLTVCSGLLLVWGTIKGTFQPEKVLDVIELVVIFYFVKKSMQNDDNQGGTNA